MDEVIAVHARLIATFGGLLGIREWPRIAEQAAGPLTAWLCESHYVLIHPAVREPLNLQKVRGQAKPYQLKQLVQLVERYNLQLEEEA